MSIFDFERIQSVLSLGVDYNNYYNNDYSKMTDSIRVADSIACVEAVAAIIVDY